MSTEIEKSIEATIKDWMFSQGLEANFTVEYAQELERTVYNQLLGAQDPHNGNICYYTPLNGKKKATIGISCCVSSEPRGISMIPALAWGTLEKGPAILLYTEGSFETPFAKITVKTSYPQQGAVRITVNNPKPKRFALQLRVPTWTKSFTASVGKQKFTGKPGSFLVIDRSWKSGDAVDINLDITVQVIPGGKSYPDAVAIQRGPQVLAAEDSLNPQGASWRAATLKESAPGKQVYTAGTLTLIPFSDATSMKVWLPKAEPRP